MRVLLFGANGQLGSDLLCVFRAAGDAVVPQTHAQVDVCNEQRVSDLVAEVRPDIVLNTTAFHRVEECEKRPELAFQVNGTAALNLAVACQRTGALLVHFSTDYVFDGRKTSAYEETDLPSPLNVYGASKVAGEHLIACRCDRYLVIRTCGLYGIAGSSGKGGNFVENMLKKASTGEPIRVVEDQVLTPTYTVDLAEATRRLILAGTCGLYHLSSEGECSWYEFTRGIFQEAGIDAQLTAVKTSDFPSPVRRPNYSVLSKLKYRTLGLAIPSWQDALSRYLRQRLKRNPAPLPLGIPANP
jgi:dTDP-4-dehydrorhamnose reductase